MTNEYELVTKNQWINFYHLFGANWEILKIVTKKNSKGIHEENHYVLSNFLDYLDYYGLDEVAKGKLVFNPATIYKDKLPPNT